MRYVTLEDCRRTVFPYIHQALSANEPAPIYEEESAGLAELHKVLELVQESYYPSLHDKAAYLVCSIAGSQYFSNGNKRLALVVLLLFLVLNDVEVKKLTENEYQKILTGHFASSWDPNPRIHGSHPLFLYNLAIAIGDRKTWTASSFPDLRQNVARIFESIYRFPPQR